MNKVYVYYCDRKEYKKLRNLSYKLKGFSFLGGDLINMPAFCGLKLSDKLERKIKLFTFSMKKPRKLQFLYNIIGKSKIYTEEEYKKLSDSELYKRFSTSYKINYLSNSYDKMPKGTTKDNGIDYNRGSGNQSGKGKHFCKECHFTFKHYPYPIGKRENHRKGWIRYKENIKCPNCGVENSTVWLPSSVRVPRKNATKQIWNNFYKLFVTKS